MPTILECLDEDKVLQIDEKVKRDFGIIGNQFQYICLETKKDCEHRYLIKGFTYCKGNREGAF